MDLVIPIESNVDQLQELDIEKLEKLKETFQGMEDHGTHRLMAVKLYKAIENDDVGGFIFNLEQVEQVSASGNSVLHKAASFGSIKIAKLIVDHFPFLLTRRNVLGDTALHVAVKARKLDVATKDSKFIDVMEVLIDANVNDREQLLEMKNNVGNTALHEAVIAQCVDAVQCLFSQNKKVSYYLNDGGESPLCLAIETGNIEILEHLLKAPYKNGGLIERPRKESPVHAAIFMKRRDMLEKIFKKNEHLFHIRDEKGKMPLHYAASKGYIDGVRFLLTKFKQHAFERSKNGDFPIHAACKRGHTKVVKEFLQQQWLYPTELLNKKSQNILHVAAENGKNDVVKAILGDSKLEELINAVDEKGNTALHLASQKLRSKVICTLTWDKRVDLKRRNKEGLTAIDIASSNRNDLKATQDLTLWILSSADTPYSEKGKKISLKQEREPPKLEQIQNLINVILVIAVLVATVTFSAALTVPGRLNRSDAVHRLAFQVFIICDSIAMYFSMTGAFVLIWALVASDREKFAINFALIVLIVAIFAMSMAFMAVVYIALSNIPWISYSLLAGGIYYLLTFSFIFTSLMFPKFRTSNRILYFICHYLVPYKLFWVRIWERVPLT
ncbi:protein ACCELERATED CELL DEATH 6-like [Quercus lobata]|uniref:PGG domain-containing protein n=1 Tax=Quercus lobata TaxID=97700 RepID=A0A7N2LM86_QUELO|nr:protein ACCELERATED CELL DEATH 6-like [Quercus lobata]